MNEFLTIAPGMTIELVRIPAGEFLMGTSGHSWTEKQHTVNLDEYMIGKYDVTNAQYAVYAKAKGQNWSMPSDKENHPVVNVSWDDAMAFCVWASQATGRKVTLPTEAQWEKAARGTDGRQFPWGNEVPSSTLANFSTSGTSAVGNYSPAGDSPYGLADMAGNVWQWVGDWYDGNDYASSPSSNPQGPISGEKRVLRGGGWDYSPANLRTASRNRDVPAIRFGSIGFRVAVSVPAP